MWTGQLDKATKPAAVSKPAALGSSHWQDAPRYPQAGRVVATALLFPSCAQERWPG
ncbi:MAG TPA: hypothetical protein VFS21_28530 [Roseiflexaceae bacterium]|nr:hypothetical protein [Roseiflexaceae bacterium]